MEIQKSTTKLSIIDPSLFGKLFFFFLFCPNWTHVDIYCRSMDVRRCCPNLKKKKKKKVHTFAIKRFLNVPLHSSNKINYGQTGRYQLFILTYIKYIKYLLKLTRLRTKRFCRQACEMFLLQHEAGRQNWAISIWHSLAKQWYWYRLLVPRCWFWGTFHR